jgi:tetratricopeptide (TPR) repeat protein
MMKCRAAVGVGIAGLVLGAIGGCAAKLPPEPPAITTAKFPDFIHPVPPQGLGTPAALERHDVGWRWLQAGDMRAAERNFQSALKQAPNFYPAEVGLGYVAFVKKNPKDSLLHFDRAVVANPRYAPALAGRAEVLLATGEHADAIKSIEAALVADPSLEALRSRLQVLRLRNQQQDITTARKLAASGRLDEARAAYQSAITASPQSPFLHRELAEIEKRAGNVDAALDAAKKAAELEPDEPRTQVLLGELYESKGDFAHAVEAFSSALSLQPDPALSEKVEAMRSRAALAAMPAEFREIEAAATVTRAQLAALLAVRLETLLTQSRRVNAVVITDTRAHWASAHILTVARAGVMEVYANHTFQPDAIVRRGDLAQAASHVLELIAARSAQLAASWRNARTRKFPDVGPRHLNYPAVSLVVEAGVMATVQDGSFQLTRPVTGAEAVAAVDKLQELGGRSLR